MPSGEPNGELGLGTRRAQPEWDTNRLSQPGALEQSILRNKNLKPFRMEVKGI